jgi:hypothetical protein
LKFNRLTGDRNEQAAGISKTKYAASSLTRLAKRRKKAPRSTWLQGAF